MNQNQRDRLQKAIEIIEEVANEEEEKLSNMEENFSETENYQNMEEKRDTLDNIKSDLEEVIQEY